MKQSIVFNRSQLVEFGNYLLSKERRELYEQSGNQTILEERLSTVNHADVENYISLLNKEQNVQESDARDGEIRCGAGEQNSSPVINNSKNTKP